MKHRYSKRGRILESSSAEADLRVKLDTNLQYNPTAQPTRTFVLRGASGNMKVALLPNMALTPSEAESVVTGMKPKTKKS